MFVAMKLFALFGSLGDPMPGPPQSVAALRTATEGGADSALLGHLIGRIAVGHKADLTVIDMKDPTWSPLNSAVRQLVHIEAGRGVRHVLVDGRLVVKDRHLVTLDEDTIFEAIRTVMPGFRHDFATVSARVVKLQPWLNEAHRRITETNVGYDRMPILF